MYCKLKIRDPNTVGLSHDGQFDGWPDCVDGEVSARNGGGRSKRQLTAKAGYRTKLNPRVGRMEIQAPVLRSFEMPKTESKSQLPPAILISGHRCNKSLIPMTLIARRNAGRATIRSCYCWL